MQALTGTAFQRIPYQDNGRHPAFLLARGFQIAAPGGFSAYPADPAFTFSGFAASMIGHTRSHHRQLAVDGQIMP